MAIITDLVTNSNLSVWGVSGAEYIINGEKVNFQDLMVAVTTQRAATIEKEVEPMSTRMTNRNKRLEKLGNALSDLSGIEAAFKSDDSGGTWSLDYLKQPSEATRTVLDSIESGLWGYGTAGKGDGKGKTGYYVTKSNCEKAIQLVKTQIDKLNNESSADMTRLQSLVDRRDESYSTATSLMQKIANTASSLIKNL